MGRSSTGDILSKSGYQIEPRDREWPGGEARDVGIITCDTMHTHIRVFKIHTHMHTHKYTHTYAHTHMA